jgi:hypothetical protein
MRSQLAVVLGVSALHVVPQLGLGGHFARMAPSITPREAAGRPENGVSHTTRAPGTRIAAALNRRLWQICAKSGALVPAKC